MYNYFFKFNNHGRGFESNISLLEIPRTKLLVELHDFW